MQIFNDFRKISCEATQKRIVKQPFLDKHSEMNCYLCKF